MRKFAACRLSQRLFFAVSEDNMDFFSARTSFPFELADDACRCRAVGHGMTKQYLQAIIIIKVRLIDLLGLYLKFTL